MASPTEPVFVDDIAEATMAERLTDERLDALEAARELPGDWCEHEEYDRDRWFDAFGREVYEPLALLLTEVRERREAVARIATLEVGTSENCRLAAELARAESRATQAEAQLQAAVDAFTFACRSEKGGGQSAIEIIARDRDAWKARANKFEATVEMLETRAEADLLNAEAAIARATQAEAQAAAMRNAIEKLATCRRCECLLDLRVPTSRCEYGCKASPAFDDDADPELVDLGALLSTDAGRTLLAELEALRALDRMLRGTWTAEERVAALAAVDAARKGET